MDAAVAVHPDFKSHTGGNPTMGEGDGETVGAGLVQFLKFATHLSNSQLVDARTTAGTTTTQNPSVLPLDVHFFMSFSRPSMIPSARPSNAHSTVPSVSP